MAVSALELVGIEKVSSVAYLRAIMACYASGRVAVPIDPGAEAPAGYSFVERLSPESGGGWFEGHQTPVRTDAPAQLTFSSGTTGEPKAVLLSHRALADVTDRLIDAMGIDGEISEYLAIPATYSFGLARARVVAAVGGRLFLPQHGFNPSEFTAMLEAGEVNALSAVPTLLRVLIANPDLMPRKIGRRLRWLEIGSQSMTLEEKQAIRRMFPAARIIQHYGLTEASRTTFLDLQEATDAQLATVGRPFGKTELKIDDELRICIRGPHVAEGILSPTGIEPIVDGDGWLHTRDLGSIDKDGFLTFEGRADDLINVGGIKVPAELFEQKLGALLGAEAAHMAVTARPDPLRGETVMIAHLGSLSAASLAAHARAVGADFGLGPADLSAVTVNDIPRTETGKVRRALLTERHAADARPLSAQSAPQEVAATAPATRGDEPQTDRERQIARIWCASLGLTTIGRDDRFFDKGGDSLSAITTVLAMEQAGIPKALTDQIFLDRSIAEIAGSETGAANDAVVLEEAAPFQPLPTVKGKAAPILDGATNRNPPDIAFWDLIAEDYRTHECDLFSQGFLMLFIHRFGNWRMSVRPKLFRAPLTIIYRFLNKMTQFLFGMKLDYVVEVGRRVKLEHFGGIIVGARRIGNDVTIRQNTTFGIRSADDMNAKPTVEDFCDLGAGVVIIGDVTIGENSIVGPNSVVLTDVPPNSVVMGIPARVIGPNKKRNRS
jgi:serine acetyltransferase